MKRFFLGIVCLIWLLPLKVQGLCLGEGSCWEATPFLAQYRKEGQLGQDMGCLYTLGDREQSVLCYAIAPGVEPTPGNYFPENLESHSEIAGRIRAVVLGGYPAMSLSQLTETANPWLLGHGYEPVCQLQSGEALLATQVTLWHLAGNCQITSCYSGWKDLSTAGWRSFRNRVRNQDCLFQQETEYTASNIASLCAYLEHLTPVAAKRRVVTADSLADATLSTWENEDGRWSVCATVSISCQMEETDQLTIQAQCGEEIQEQPLNRQGEYSFSFSDLPEPEAVTLTISGTQQGEDVYLYQNGDNRLVGYAQGEIAVQGQVTLEAERILHLYKTTPKDAGGQPLANIQFNLYLAATLEQLTRREVRLSQTPTAEEVEACQNPQSLVAILSTDEDGTASYNFTSGGDPDGVYLVVEQYSPATAGPVEPFYITVPGDTPNALEIHLENRGEAMPELTLEREEEPYCVGSEQIWQLRATLPAGLGNGRAFTLTDFFPTGLEWLPDSLIVTLSGLGEEVVDLVEDIHYTREAGAQQLTISMTPAGMAFCASGEGEKTLVLSFAGKLTQSAASGQSIVNRAKLDYENAAGLRFSQAVESEAMTISSIHVTQLTGDGEKITGARYALARAAQPGEKDTEVLSVEGQEVAVTWLSFWQTPDMTGLPVTEVTIGQDGAWLSGLGAGDYYLVEQRSATGYRAGEPIPVTLGENVLELTVQPAYLLPDTGSAGILGLTALGIFSILAACWLLWRSRKDAAI